MSMRSTTRQQATVLAIMDRLDRLEERIMDRLDQLEEPGPPEPFEWTDADGDDPPEIGRAHV